MSLFFLLKNPENNLKQPKSTKDNQKGRKVWPSGSRKEPSCVALPLCVNALRLVAVCVAAAGCSDDSTKNNLKQPKSTKAEQPKTTKINLNQPKGAQGVAVQKPERAALRGLAVVCQRLAARCRVRGRRWLF